MDTLQLSSFLHNDPHISHAGVYAADELPLRTAVPVFIIANTDKASKPGRHWVTLFIDANRRCEYFHSYGMKPTIPSTLNFIQRNSVIWTRNNVLLQALSSKVCGQYCACFLALRARGLTMQDF